MGGCRDLHVSRDFGSVPSLVPATGGLGCERSRNFHQICPQPSGLQLICLYDEDAFMFLNSKHWKILFRTTSHRNYTPPNSAAIPKTNVATTLLITGNIHR